MGDRARLEGYAAGNLRRAIVIGDSRPSHYLAQSVGFLETGLLPRIDSFKSFNGLVVILKDACFIDPRLLFPKLLEFECVETTRAELSEFVLQQKLCCMRFIRRGNDKDFSVIRRLVASRLPSEGQARGGPAAWIFIDIEKKRFANQLEVLAAAVRRLAADAKASGQRLNVLWDGWTIQGGNRTPRDELIISQAVAMIQQIRDLSGADYDDEMLFDRDLLEKLSRGTTAQVALASYGTASMMASLLAGTPCVTWGVRDYVRDAEFLDTSNAEVISEPELIVLGSPDLKPSFQNFEIPPAEAIGAIDRLLAQRQPVAAS
ncbi:MAG: hypothetical protein B7Y99_03110 [Caulobacterales bacterium 32-69-10]|nr:MAG: hypothetical protein B7Y99_03110 [Caulobacterales bacterium 32-69-10]